MFIIEDKKDYCSILFLSIEINKDEFIIPYSDALVDCEKKLLEYTKDNIKTSEKNLLELYLSIEKQYYETLYYTKLKDIKKKKEFSYKKFNSLIQYLISDKIKDEKKKKIYIEY